MGNRCTNVSKEQQLMALHALCSRLNADVRYYDGDSYFTVLMPPPWKEETMRSAQELQQKIKGWSEQYQDIVCYCFDPYSTLIYVL